jgi:thiol-disulfide isomerase/thioredoxin
MGSRSEGPSGSRSPATYLLAAAISALAGFAAIYLTFGGSDNAARVTAPSRPVEKAEAPRAPATELPARKGLAAFAKGQMTAFVVKPETEALPELAFEDVSAGQTRGMKDYAGRIVLLNLWATWCAPCLREMPALDKLKADLAGKDFEVVALNIDKGGPEKPRKFLADAGIRSLALMHDKEGKAFAALKIAGMPTTLLIGRDGREIGRLVGPAEWDSDDAKALIRAAIEK